MDLLRPETQSQSFSSDVVGATTNNLSSIHQSSVPQSNALNTPIQASQQEDDSSFLSTNQGNSNNLVDISCFQGVDFDRMLSFMKTVRAESFPNFNKKLPKTYSQFRMLNPNQVKIFVAMFLDLIEPIQVSS
jgi:hypothetical protein